MTCYPCPLDELAVAALNPAVERDGHDWAQIVEWLNMGAAQVWQVGGRAYVLTLANGDDEIEVLLCGGKDVRPLVPVWEAAMWQYRAHIGKTFRVEGRKGWRRLLPHWQERDGVLYMKVND